MRIVAVSDTHYPIPAQLVPDGDVLLHAGDFMYTGYPDEWYPRLEALARLPHKHKFMVPGNHDAHIHNYEGIARAELRRLANTHLLVGRTPMRELPNGMKVLGIPYVTGLPGWSYNVEEDWLAEYLTTVTDFEADIVVSHSPPYRILDDVRPENPYPGSNVGSWALHAWWRNLKVKPQHWICGHIHESRGQLALGGTEFHNASMCDRDYKQVNAPWVIDVED